jgi:hypothetical protein
METRITVRLTNSGLDDEHYLRTELERDTSLSWSTEHHSDGGHLALSETIILSTIIANVAGNLGAEFIKSAARKAVERLRERRLDNKPEAVIEEELVEPERVGQEPSDRD